MQHPHRAQVFEPVDVFDRHLVVEHEQVAGVDAHQAPEHEQAVDAGQHPALGQPGLPVAGGQAGVLQHVPKAGRRGPVLAQVQIALQGQAAAGGVGEERLLGLAGRGARGREAAHQVQAGEVALQEVLGHEALAPGGPTGHGQEEQRLHQGRVLAVQQGPEPRQAGLAEDHLAEQVVALQQKGQVAGLARAQLQVAEQGRDRGGQGPLGPLLVVEQHGQHEQAADLGLAAQELGQRGGEALELQGGDPHDARRGGPELLAGHLVAELHVLEALQAALLHRAELEGGGQAAAGHGVVGRLGQQAVHEVGAVAEQAVQVLGEAGQIEKLLHQIALQAAAQALQMLGHLLEGRGHGLGLGREEAGQLVAAAVHLPQAGGRGGGQGAGLGLAHQAAEPVQLLARVDELGGQGPGGRVQHQVDARVAQVGFPARGQVLAQPHQIGRGQLRGV